MSLDDKVSDSDQIYSSHGVKVIVDDQTLAYLQRATIKFVEENGQSGFQIEQTAPSTAPAGCAGCDPSTLTLKWERICDACSWDVEIMVDRIRKVYDEVALEAPTPG